MECRIRTPVPIECPPTLITREISFLSKGLPISLRQIRQLEQYLELMVEIHHPAAMAETYRLTSVH